MKMKRFASRLLLALVLLVLFYQVWVFLHIVWWRTHNPETTAFMEARLEVLREKNPKASIQHRWVPYDRISRNLKRAVVAAEDSRFTQHQGFDWEGIRHAYEKNLKKGRIVAGGSTISQQLAKNLFLSTRKTPWRKAQEAAITVMLESVMSKRRILEIYLNMIEWGNGVFGAEAASRHYYGTSASNLSAWQAAALAATIPNPRYYDSHRNSRYLARHTGVIVKRMHQVRIP